MSSGWIAVDLDGTLARYGHWQGENHIGEPIVPMVERVQDWLARGIEVRIFTARMAGHGVKLVDGTVVDVVTPIQEWCLEHIGAVLPVTNVKDFAMVELWDDRAISVEYNTGRITSEGRHHKRPL